MVNLLAYAKAHKPQAALGGGAIAAVGVGLYRRRKAGAAGAGSTAAVPASATTASVQPDSAGGVPYDPAASGDAASMYLPQISQQLTGLTTAVAAVGSKINSTSANAPKPGAKPSRRHVPPDQQHLNDIAQRRHLQHEAHLAHLRHEQHLAHLAHQRHIGATR